MMLSPELYYEELKNKNVEEIEQEINELKNGINVLKATLEARQKGFVEDAEKQYGIEMPIDDMDPSYNLQLQMNKEYLAYAIRAYKEKGKDYAPAELEIKSAQLNDNLNQLCSLKFEHWSELGFRRNELIVNVYKNKTIIEANFVDFDNENWDDIPDKHKKHILYSTEADKAIQILTQKLKRLYLGEWKSQYEPKDLAVMDGFSWSVNVIFNDKTPDFNSQGSNCYPFSFELLLDLTEFYAACSKEEVLDDFII